MATQTERLEAAFRRVIQHLKNRTGALSDLTTTVKTNLVAAVNEVRGMFGSAANITQDSTHRFVSDTEKSTWNGKVDTSAIVNNLTQATAGYVLDARQGKALNDVITALKGGSTETIASLKSSLDTLNSLVTSTTPDGDSLVNTIQELLAIFSDYPEGASVATALSGKLSKSSNLSDLSNVASARSNLGLGALATKGTIGTTDVDDNVLTNAKLAQVSTGTMKGRLTSGTGNVEDLTASQVRSFINVSDGANTRRYVDNLGNRSTSYSIDVTNYDEYDLYVTITGNFTLTITGAALGKKIYIRVTQGSSTGYTITFSPSVTFASTVSWNSGTSGKINTFALVCYSSTVIEGNWTKYP